MERGGCSNQNFRAVFKFTSSRAMLGLVLFFLLIALLSYGAMNGADFRVFYVAGERFLHGLPLYQVGDGWAPYKYHPSWALAFSVWSLLPFPVAAFLFDAMNLLFWMAAAYQWSAWLGYRWSLGRVLLLVVLGLNPLSAEIAYGQVNGFLFWGCTQIFDGMEREDARPLRSGVMLAILASIKLNLGLLGFYLLIKQPRSVLGFLAGALGLHLISMAMFGSLLNLELYREWLHLLLSQSSDQFGNFEVQGLLRAYDALFGPRGGSLAWGALLTLALVMGFFLNRREGLSARQRLIFNGSYWLGLIFFFSPLAWWYQILYLYPMLFLLLRTPLSRPLKGLLWACVICFAFIGYNTVGGAALNLFKLYFGFFAGAVVLFGIYLRTAWSPSRLAQISGQPESSVSQVA